MKRAIVTGGAGLIGTGIMRHLRTLGWEVASFDMKELDAELQDDGSRSIFCDVGDEASVHGAFAELGWDSLDLLVNNAGIAGPVNGSIVEGRDRRAHPCARDQSRAENPRERHCARLDQRR